MDHQYTIMDDNELEYNPDADELLIELVQARPHLYDKKDPNVKNAELKNNSWATIASAAAMSVDECLNRWHRLRERYAKFSKLNAKAEALGTEKKYFPFYEKLAFLDPHIKRRKRYHCKTTPAKPTLAAKQPVTYVAYDVSPSSVSTRTVIPSGAKLMTLGNNNYIVSNVIPNKKQGVRNVAAVPSLGQNESLRVKREKSNGQTEEIHLVPNKVLRYEDDDSRNASSPNNSYEEESDPLFCDNAVKSTIVKGRTMDSTDYFSLFVSEELKKLPEDARKEKKKKIFAILME